MTSEKLESLACKFVRESEKNKVPSDKALQEHLIGMRFFDEPIFGYAAADDSYLTNLPNVPEANINLTLPEVWLPGSKTVISFFLPFTKMVRESNRRNMDWPSDEWKHARIEGQVFVIAFSMFLKAQLEHKGHTALVPATDKRFVQINIMPEKEGEKGMFTSNWSERHVGYAAGLGTFSLSKGLITKKGVAGRFGSVITTLHITPSQRYYNGIYDYCIKCGACIRNCPAEAITKEDGKKHAPCKIFIDKVLAEHPPYYGCGKCQVNVPCEAAIPNKKMFAV